MVTAQSNEWQWVTGPNVLAPQVTSQPGVYGPAGVFGPNYIPFGRSEISTWKGKDGNFWVFGGYPGWLDLWQFNPTTKQWAWMVGAGPNCTSACGPNGTYGTKGVPQAGLTPGGRQDAATWTDSQGRLWLFGGLGYDYNAYLNRAPLNDLWMFDPSTNVWAWMGGDVELTPAVYGTRGQPNAANIPGARYSALTWTDKNGNFWMYGGLGFDANGGSESSPVNLDDLWMFNPTTMEWTWVGGENVSSGTSPVYGTKGVFAAANSPGQRVSSATWTDANGNFWLYSGATQINDSVNGLSASYLESNDVWEYNPSTNEWAWMAGTDAPACTYGGLLPACNTDAVYGTIGRSSAQSSPGPRTHAYAWVDKSGNFWLFGGFIYAQTLYYNDIWKYTPSSGQWAWMGGMQPVCSDIDLGHGASFGCGNPAHYGNQGIPSPDNLPGAREGGGSWTDQDGNLWLFGGSVYDHAVLTLADYNDVWEYTPSATSLPPMLTPQITPAGGQYTAPQSVTMTEGYTNASIYYTTDGSTPNTSSNLYSGPIAVNTSETIQAIAAAPGYPDSPVAKADYALVTVAPNFSPMPGTYSSTQMVTLTDATPGASIYYTTDGSTPTTSSTLYGGRIQVSTTTTLEAFAVAANYTVSPVGTAVYTIASPSFTVATSPSSLTVNAGGQTTATLTLTPQNGFNSTTTFACSGLPSGVTCTFSPTTVTPSGGANATTTLTIAASASAAMRRQSRPWLPAGALSLAGLLLWWRPRRRTSIWFAVLFAAVGLSLISACGGGGASGGGGTGGGSGGGSSPTPTTSTITITGTSGTLQASTTLTLTLN